MRKYLVLMLFVFCLSINAQTKKYTITCGNDTAFCENKINYLGTKVKILNGSPPYKYCWSMNKIHLFNTYLIASYVLSDTSILNPIFKGWAPPVNKFHFYLTITDSLGKVATDSINVKYSFYIIEGGLEQFNLIKGDSLLFGTEQIGGGILPLKFYWTPITGVLDSSANPTWFKPMGSTNYYQYVIDSAGCKSSAIDVLSITVNTTAVTIINVPTIIFHQEGSKLVFSNFQNANAIIKLYSVDGNCVYTIETMDSFISVPKQFNNNIYICVLNIGNNQETCKFLNNY